MACALSHRRCGCSRQARRHPKKSTAHASQKQRPDVKARRRAWLEGQLDLDPRKLIFIDETAASTRMARLRGRGQSVANDVAPPSPHGHWKTITFTARLRLSGLAVPRQPGNSTGRLLASPSWSMQSRCSPRSFPADIVIMDNLPAHKIAGVRASGGARLLLLAPYSPDFNPIEMAAAQEAAARSIDELWSAVADCLTSFKPPNAEITSSQSDMTSGRRAARP